jgi:pyrrolysyl-tRNA synthetase-like protein
MTEKKRYYRKNLNLFLLLDQIRLWPSRSGAVHGIRDLQANGKYITVTTFCGKTFRVYDSRTSRAARWLRNKWAVSACPDCKVPAWKLEKYSKTVFSDYGSDLQHKL